MLKFCSLSSGSSGNCYYIATENTGILVDAGISCTRIKKSLEHIGESIDRVQAVFVTHEHSDHISGLSVLLKKYPISLHLTEGTYSGIRGISDYFTHKPIRQFKTGDSTRVGDLTIRSYRVSHDAKEPVCYKISTDDGENVGIITDLGWADPEVIHAFEDCDLILLESNHDVELLKIGPYQQFLKNRILSKSGHLSNDSAGVIARNIIAKGRLKYLVLGHLSETNNHVDLAYETVNQSIREFGYENGVDYELDVSVRNQVGKMYRIKRMLAFLLVLASLFYSGLSPLFADELLMREQVTYDLPVLNVIVVENGKTVEFVSRKLEEGVLSDYSALLEIGSLARVTTSHALLDLLNQKNISLESEISAYLPPGFNAEKTQGIRFQDLFMHTTGYVNNRYATLSVKPYEKSIGQRALEYLKTCDRRFEHEEYSLLATSDFAFMTLLIEQISQKNYQDYMSGFFLKWGMKDTVVEQPEELKKDAVMPRYHSSSGQLLRAREYHALIPAADLLITSLSDMERYLKVLTDPNLPKKYKFFAKTFTNINEKTARSFVFNHFEYHDRDVYLLDSSLPGSVNRMIFIPERNIGIFIGYNSDNIEAREKITFTLLDQLGMNASPNNQTYVESRNTGVLGGYYSPVNISGRTIEKFVAFSHQLKISHIDDGILIGEDYFRPVSESIYYSEQSQKYARFATDEGGRLRYLVLDNELYERAFSTNVQLLSLFFLTLISVVLLIHIIVRWHALIAGRVDDRPRVWLLFAQLILLCNIGLTALAVRQTGYWDLAYGCGLALSVLKYFGWTCVLSVMLSASTLAYTRNDYKWRGFFRLLTVAGMILTVVYLYWMMKFRLVIFFL